MFLKLSWKLATSEKRASSPLVTDSNAELEVNSLMEVQNHSEPTITLQPTTLVSVVEAVVKRFIFLLAFIPSLLATGRGV